ncbi:hypothetical protein GGS24DRAFT_496212 [Hypoxylon argillaceum]|nr:hypothetical protein GGS24DRAFT_496212 [Hypoxylon argillaceum]
MSNQTSPFNNNLTTLRRKLVVSTVAKIARQSVPVVTKSFEGFYSTECVKLLEQGITEVSEELISSRAERDCWEHWLKDHVSIVNGSRVEKYPWPFQYSETFQDGMLESATYAQFLEANAAYLEKRKAEATKLAEQVQPSQPKPASQVPVEVKKQEAPVASNLVERLQQLALTDSPSTKKPGESGELVSEKDKQDLIEEAEKASIYFEKLAESLREGSRVPSHGFDAIPPAPSGGPSTQEPVPAAPTQPKPAPAQAKQPSTLPEIPRPSKIDWADLVEEELEEREEAARAKAAASKTPPAPTTVPQHTSTQGQSVVTAPAKEEGDKKPQGHMLSFVNVDGLTEHFVSASPYAGPGKQVDYSKVAWTPPLTMRAKDAAEEKGSEGSKIKKTRSEQLGRIFRQYKPGERTFVPYLEPFETPLLTPASVVIGKRGISIETASKEIDCQWVRIFVRHAPPNPWDATHCLSLDLTAKAEAVIKVKPGDAAINQAVVYAWRLMLAHLRRTALVVSKQESAGMKEVEVEKEWATVPSIDTCFKREADAIRSAAISGKTLSQRESLTQALSHLEDMRVCWAREQDIRTVLKRIKHGVTKEVQPLVKKQPEFEAALIKCFNIILGRNSQTYMSPRRLTQAFRELIKDIKADGGATLYNFQRHCEGLTAEKIAAIKKEQAINKEAERKNLW